MVEAQHRIATLKLVDTPAEQAVLEELLEASKPDLAEGTGDLDYLLATPFRYRPQGRGSRFRRPGPGPGVFYGAERVETALAEAAFWRLMFFADAPDVPWPVHPLEHTAFAVRIAVKRAIDLTTPPLDARRADWTSPADYGPCQALAEEARGGGIELIRYASVRDPGRGINLALLAPKGFAARAPVAAETWRLVPGAFGLVALAEFPRRMLEFGREAFAGDPRMDGFDWERKSAGKPPAP